jgi:hypothetical protein
MTSSPVKHPILRLEVIAPDGTRQDEHRVFCRLQRRSVHVEECCECLHCDAITDGETPSVDCTIPIAPILATEDPTGEQTEVGMLLCTGAVVVAQSAAVESALRVLRADARRSVAVVDHRHALVGIIHETGFVGRGPSSRYGAVSTAMSTAIAVHESTPVRTALKLLAANHLREATVIADDGVPIGIFRDVDGLHWLGVARGTTR